MTLAGQKQLVGRVTDRARAWSVAAITFVWFFAAPLFFGSTGFWLMPAAIAVASVLLRIGTSLAPKRLLLMVGIGLFAGVAIDMMIRGIPMFLLSNRWDWLEEVAISVVLGLLGAAVGSGLGSLALRLFRRRTV